MRGESRTMTNDEFMVAGWKLQVAGYKLQVEKLKV